MPLFIWVHSVHRKLHHSWTVFVVRNKVENNNDVTLYLHSAQQNASSPIRTQLGWRGGVLALCGRGCSGAVGGVFPPARCWCCLQIRSGDAGDTAGLGPLSCVVWRNRKLHSALRISGYEAIWWRNFWAYFSVFFFSFCRGIRRGDRKAVLKVKENAVTLLQRHGKHCAARASSVTG